jgi:hypothetical protein
MPPKKRDSDLSRPKKRVKSSTARGTVSQPIPADSQPSPSRLSFCVCVLVRTFYGDVLLRMNRGQLAED